MIIAIKNVSQQYCKTFLYNAGYGKKGVYMFTVSKNTAEITIESSEMYKYKNDTMDLCAKFARENNAEESSGVMVVLRELLINAIEHGVSGVISPVVCVKLKKYKNNLFQIIVFDNGNGFNFKTIKPKLLPDDPRGIEKRGYYLIYSLSEKVEFNEKGNCITAYVSAD